MKLKLWLQSATAAGAIFATAGMAFSEGMLRYATVGEPPSLDQHVITSDLATTIAHHMFEGLYTFNAANEPVGLLAAGETLSDDGKIITIALRDDVDFHNGQHMTSAMSWHRWCAGANSVRAAACCLAMSRALNQPANTK